MDPIQNPYRPGAGTRPIVLAGREAEIEKAKNLLLSVRAGAPQRSLMLYGLRGVGKTVLLNHVEGLAEEFGFQVEHLEMSETDDFRRVIAKSVRKLILGISTFENLKDKARRALGILKAFSIAIPGGPELKIDVDAVVGIADSGDLDSDIVDLIVALGEAAQEAGKPVCLLIDEVQYLTEKAVSGLIAASHRISQKGFPVVFVCAGLPQIAALAGDARSYAERLFEFIPISTLKGGAAEQALLGPAQDKGVQFQDGAKRLVLDDTEGYPYFIQEFGKHIWNVAASSPISEADAQAGRSLAIESLDQSFFKVRIDRATKAERGFMKAMAALGPGPYKMGDVAKKRGVEINSLGPVRATLIGKGFVYSPSHGLIEFSVPQFDSFIRRHFEALE